ncbi:MAG TPA: hypothetical protein VFQ61_37990, partial [Polyangiaceae bacterium]|nr:hypothetical protein [Polyangiaceae bacterium]
PGTLAPNMQLIAKLASVSSLARQFTSDAEAEPEPVPIANFTPSADPLLIELPEFDPTAAALSYIVNVDGVDVKATESVILESAPSEEEVLF